jgi:PhzF family phenazine biosynthesis protein
MLEIYQVDAFTDKLFGGNPAAVVPMPRWPNDGLLQSIAAENNLAETAFIVERDNQWDIRWFTPLAEVALCGHATR